MLDAQRKISLPLPLMVSTVGTAPARDRIQAWDIYRGLAILAVLLIHVSGHFLKSVASDSWAWFVLAVPNCALQFAVPGFLALSTYLNASKLLQGGSVARYALGRMRRVLWPYLLWSDIYILYRYWDQPQELEWSRILHMLLWGKGSYHLYFLIVVLQLYIVLPFLVILFRRPPPFWTVTLGAVLLQVGGFLLNRYVYTVPYIGSLLLSYTLPIALSLWLASRPNLLGRLLDKGRLAAILFGIGGFSLFCPLWLESLRGRPVDGTLFSIGYSLGYWCYTASACFLLFVVARNLEAWKGGPFLQTCGLYSLEIYLIHPLIIAMLSDYLPIAGSLSVMSLIMIYFSVCLFIPLLIGRVTTALRLSRLLFGNDGPVSSR